MRRTGGNDISSGAAVTLIDPLPQFLLLARFLCFMAVLYLALHKLAARLSVDSKSRLRWFFAVLTSPLTRPVRARMKPGTTDDRIISVSLLVYGILWLLTILAEHSLRMTLR
jgi:hypothetical protein